MNIALIFGGKSSEHEISRMSASAVLKWLVKVDNDDSEKNEILKLGIDKEGRWFLTEASPEEIFNGRWEDNKNNRPAYITPDSLVHGMVILDEDRFIHKKIDVVIPVLHGDHGEDGDIQGLLNMAEIPYVGCGVAASANSMDKSLTKKLVGYTKVRQAEYIEIRKNEYLEDKEKELLRVKNKFNGNYNLFVKPSSAGSSIGASGIKSEEELPKAIELALKEDKKVLIEEKIVGREIEVAILGNDEPKASEVGEILSAGEFYDYDSKYKNPKSRTRIVSDLPRATIDEIRSKAIEIYKALECRGLSRVDFFYTEDGEIVFNEINTFPGFTSISMYPLLWQDRGISGEELIKDLIELAINQE